MNWKNLIITTILTAVATLVTGVLLSWWQEKEPSLSYRVVTSIPFDGSDGQLRIGQVDIYSDGKKAVEKVFINVALSSATIENHKIEIDSAIPYKEELSNAGLRLQIESLNPGESARISLLFKQSNGEVSPSPIKVSLRGSGVLGAPQEEGEKSKPSLWVALASAYVGLLAAVLSMRRGREVFFKVMKVARSGSLPSSGNQREHIASTLALYGFSSDASEYSSSSSPRKYWVEADVLAAKAIKHWPAEDQARMSSALQHLAAEESMAEESRAIVFYSAAKIEHHLGNTEKFNFLIEKAKSHSKQDIEARLASDPFWQRKS
jgi:hypothetical protein